MLQSIIAVTAIFFASIFGANQNPVHTLQNQDAPMAISTDTSVVSKSSISASLIFASTTVDCPLIFDQIIEFKPHWIKYNVASRVNGLSSVSILYPQSLGQVLESTSSDAVELEFYPNGPEGPYCAGLDIYPVVTLSPGESFLHYVYAEINNTDSERIIYPSAVDDYPALVESAASSSPITYYDARLPRGKVLHVLFFGLETHGDPNDSVTSLRSIEDQIMGKLKFTLD